MPPLPVVPHQLTKIRSENRVLLVRFAFLFSVCAVFSNIISKFYLNFNSKKGKKILI